MTVWRVPVEISWNGPGSPGVNVWHVRCNSGLGADATELQAAVDSIHTFYEQLGGDGAVANPILAPGATLRLGTVLEVSSESQGSPTWVDIPGVAGATAAPPALQVCISWRTSLAARRGRGRTFLGPLSGELVASDGTPSPALMQEANYAAQGIVDRNQGNNGWAVAIWGQESRMSGPNITPKMRAAAPHVARDITGFAIRDTFAVLRSRRD